MTKKIRWIGITLLAVAILSIGIGGGIVSADTPTSTSNLQPCSGAGNGFRFGGVFVDEVVTKLLNMTDDEIHAMRQEGKSLVQIAATKDVTEQQLVAAIIDYKAAQVQNRVTAGTLTQDQANLVIERMKESTTLAINRTSVGPMNGKGIGNGQRGNMLNNGTGTGVGQGKMNRWAR